jgi:hypothetical protein
MVTNDPVQTLTLREQYVLLRVGLAFSYSELQAETVADIDPKGPSLSLTTTTTMVVNEGNKRG